MFPQDNFLIQNLRIGLSSFRHLPEITFPTFETHRIQHKTCEECFCDHLSSRKMPYSKLIAALSQWCKSVRVVMFSLQKTFSHLWQHSESVAEESPLLFACSSQSL